MRYFFNAALFLGILLLSTSLFAGPVKITPQSIQFPDNSTQTSSAHAFTNTVFVSPGTTESEGGTALLNALDGITDAASYNRYLLKLEPGNYQLGTNSLVMKRYVDIEGSGMASTVIKSNVYYTGSVLKAAVVGKTTAELRNITIKCDPETGFFSGNGIGLLNASESPGLHRVKIIVTGKSSYSAYGIYNMGAGIEWSEVDVHVSQGKYVYGIFNCRGTNIKMKNSTILLEDGGDRIYGILNGDTLDPAGEYSYYELERVHIQIISGALGNPKCYGLYNDGNAPGVPMTVKWSEIDANRSAIDGAAIYNNTAYYVHVMGSFLIGKNFIRTPAGPGQYQCVFLLRHKFRATGFWLYLLTFGLIHALEVSEGGIIVTSSNLGAKLF